MGVLALAMIFGGLAAVAALIVGQSFLMALAVYSGCGLLGVLALVLATAAMSALQNRKRDLLQTDATA